jgi:hypothetical protein
LRQSSSPARRRSLIQPPPPAGAAPGGLSAGPAPAPLVGLMMRALGSCQTTAAAWIMMPELVASDCCWPCLACLAGSVFWSSSFCSSPDLLAGDAAAAAAAACCRQVKPALSGGLCCWSRVGVRLGNGLLGLPAPDDDAAGPQSWGPAAAAGAKRLLPPGAAFPAGPRLLERHPNRKQPARGSGLPWGRTPLLILVAGLWERPLAWALLEGVGRAQRGGNHHTVLAALPHRMPSARLGAAGGGSHLGDARALHARGMPTTCAWWRSSALFR